VVKANTIISKAKSTIASFLKAADKIDRVWKASKTAQAAGTVGSIAGGLLAIAGGIATAMTMGATPPLVIAGLGIGVAEASTNLVVNLKEASIESSEIKKAEEKLRDTRDSVNDMKDTIRLWMKTKEDVRLLYICCLAELNTNDLVKGLLWDQVLHPIMVSALKVSRPEMKPPRRRRMSLKDKAVDGVANVARTGLIDGGTKVAGKVAGKVMMGVSAVLVIRGAIDLHYTIKDIVEDKGSGAARCLRQKADELKSLLPDES